MEHLGPKRRNRGYIAVKQQTDICMGRPRLILCVTKEKVCSSDTPQFVGHVTLDPKTLQLVYIPWNVSQQEVETAMSKLDSTLLKKELIEQPECEVLDLTEMDDKPLGTSTVDNQGVLQRIPK